MGEFEKRIWKLSEHYNKILRGKPISMNAVHLHVENILSKQKQMIEEAKQEFPFEKSSKWSSVIEELQYWKKVKLTSQSRETASWIRGRIKNLEWFLRWFGNGKEDK